MNGTISKKKESYFLRLFHIYNIITLLKNRELKYYNYGILICNQCVESVLILKSFEVWPVDLQCKLEDILRFDIFIQ